MKMKRLAFTLAMALATAGAGAALAQTSTSSTAKKTARKPAARKVAPARIDPAQAKVSTTTAQVRNAPAPPQSRPAATHTNAELESVLTQMDEAATKFQSAEADFAWDQYQKVVEETDTQKGRIFFRRHGKETQMAADITEPEKKYLLFSEGKIRFYQPKIEQLTEREVGANRAEVESFLVLGFGGRGHDLTKSFDVKFLGWEQIAGVRTAKLDLTPKSQKIRSMFEHIVLWIDPARGVSLKQQAFEPSGDHRTATYSNIKLNEKVGDDAFKLKTTSKTKVVRP